MFASELTNPVHYAIFQPVELQTSSMSNHHNILIWVDHRQAMIFQFDAEGFDRAAVRSAHPDRHLHHIARSGQNGNSSPDKTFFKRVAQSIQEPCAILITGPANAKTDLAEYIERTLPALAGRISGVESLDRPTNAALIALVRAFFPSDDRLHSQPVR
jgi:stalled ribosome rescue protein Dom34